MMKYIKEKYIKEIKSKFSWKIYFLICGILILYNLLQKVAPVEMWPDLYTYSYGFIYPWLVIYKNTDIGISSIAQCVRAGGYLGTEWLPQYVFIEAAIVYIAGITLYICWHNWKDRHSKNM